MLADIAPGYAIFCSAHARLRQRENPNPWQTVGGTSAATPLLAGGLALVDQELRAARRQDLGLVNPLLYEIGRNRGAAPRRCSPTCSSSATTSARTSPATTGRSAAAPPAAGFDAASGWGSVNLAGLAAVAVLLTPPRRQAHRCRCPASGRSRDAVLATVSCSAAAGSGRQRDVTIGRARPFRVRLAHRPLQPGGQDDRPDPASVREHLQQAALGALHRHRRITFDRHSACCTTRGTHVRAPSRRGTITVRAAGYASGRALGRRARPRTERCRRARCASPGAPRRTSHADAPIRARFVVEIRRGPRRAII